MDATLLRRRNFALLWLAGLISIAGDWMLRIALPIYVLTLTGSVLLTSVMVMVTLAPMLCLGLFAGVFVDRWDRRKVMIVTRLAQGVLVLPLVLIDGQDRLWIAYAVAFAQSVLVQFFAPAENALLPSVVEADQLGAANSLNALNNNLGRLIGPVLGGFGAATLGLGGVAMVDAATFFVAAGMVWLVTGRFRAVSHERTRVSHELAEGLRAVRGSRVVLIIMMIFIVKSVGEGIMASLFPALVTGPLRGGANEMGWLMSAQAVGGVLGGLAGTRYARRIRPALLIAVGLTLFGAIDIVIFNYPRWSTVLWPELVLFALVGIPGVLSGAALMTLLQTEVGDAHLGRVFSVAMVLEAVAALAGAGLAGTLGPTLGVMNLLTIQGLGYFVAGLCAGLFLGRAQMMSGRRPFHLGSTRSASVSSAPSNTVA